MNADVTTTPARFRCPFPMLKSPFAEQLQDITDKQWIDGKYLCLYLRQVWSGSNLFAVLCFGHFIMMICMKRPLFRK
ncbi:hypothetical protein DCC81_18005 [Chitinophaga parva]|uniref:Uncharacterized protein n=1 Tax=Chitinophaga parva TaxID=2169414 RepID=A0A2T7BIQ4_9BACT|nr:hypothetical protein DCC81_18005 [Chitinophaga parva]